MLIARGYDSLDRPLRHPVVAIGNFDGVHRGHAFLFGEAQRLAKMTGAEAAVLTFDPHPAKLLAPAYAPPLITTAERKLELIAQTGVDAVVVQPFDRAFAAHSPAHFIDEVLVRGLGASQVVVGWDFTFGEKRAGNVETLKADRRFGVSVVAPVAVDGLVCSSTKIREFVVEGRVDGAQLLLGRPHEVEGEVVRGDGRGRQIGVPTANLKLRTELVPKNGVYSGFAEVRSGAHTGRRFGAAINIGTNPTFVADRPVVVEAHLLDCDLDLYGEQLRVGFVERLRSEERFASIAALVAQIGKDVERARQAWEQRG
jgi:riboflavin kinase/FMN adenylyltransferase